MEDRAGRRIRIGVDGITIGRDPSCDVIVADATASRLQAMVRPLRRGFQLRALGRHPAKLNDKPVTSKAMLQDGDVIAMPGAMFIVRVDVVTWVRPVWLCQMDELSIRIGPRPLRIGSGLDDTVWLEELPPSALEVCLAERGLTAQLRVSAVLNDQPVEAGAVLELNSRSVLQLGSRVLRFLSDADGPAATVGGSLSPPMARKVAFSFLPVGGRLDLTYDHGTYTAELSELRARLVVALLSPRGDYEAGDFVPDEMIIPAVWPGERTRGRLDMNTLVHRLRRSLTSAGIDPTTVVERARAGGATRFNLNEGAIISVE